MSKTRAATALAAIAAIAAGCGSAPAQPSPAAPTTKVTATLPRTPADDAFATYNSFWTLRSSMMAAPGKQNWSTDISRLAIDPARGNAVKEAKFYAEHHAHIQGDPRRSPTIVAAHGNRVVIRDCIDVTHSNLVSDKSNKNLRAPGQPNRYQLDAVVIKANNQWMVQQMHPELRQSC